MKPGHTAPAADLFGQALLDYSRGGRLPVHLRRGDGRLALLDVASYFSDYPGFSPLERELLSLVRGAVLDLGAGAGRFALYVQSLAGRGGAVSDVVALDSSGGACACMRRRGVRLVVHSSWERVRETGMWRDRFDAILLGGFGLGLAGRPEALLGFLEWLTSLLRPGGLVLGTGQLPEGAGGAQTLRLRVEYRGRSGEWFDWLMLSPGDLMAPAANAGLIAGRWWFGRGPLVQAAPVGAGGDPASMSFPGAGEFGVALEKPPDGPDGTPGGISTETADRRSVDVP